MAAERFGKLLSAVRRRLIASSWLYFAALFLTWACGLALLWLVTVRLFPILGPPEPLLILLLVFAGAASFFMTYLQRPSFSATALEVDRRLGLEERITTSLELAEAEGDLVQALHRDAQSHACNINVHKDFPLRIPRIVKWFAIVLMAYALAYVLLPEFDVLGHREHIAKARELRETMKVRAQKLEEAMRPIRELPESERHPNLTENVKEVKRIAEGLESGELSEKQVLAKLTNMAKEMREERDKIASKTPIPRPGMNKANLDKTKDLASSIEEGNFEEAAEKAKKLQQEIAEKVKEEEGLSQEEREALAKELAELAKQLGGKDSMLGQALEEAAEGMTVKDAQGVLAALEQMQMAMEDVASSMEQMKQMEMAMQCMGEGCKACSGGKFDLAAFGMGQGQGQGRGQGMGQGWGRRGPGRSAWQPGASQRSGPGMGGPGSGRGGTTGDLPDVQADFSPTVLPGEMTPGKILSSIMEHNAPDEDPEATAEFITETIIEVQQAAEEALTKEEIPQGSKEFVRQYFGSLEHERSPRGRRD
ncbi:MAG: hypothetical protein R6V12_17090 [Candidatus Hydrogenedentota bacterium]